MFYVMIEFLPVHLELSPPVDPQMEDKTSELFVQAGMIVDRMESIPNSTINALLKRLRKDLSDLERDALRERLQEEISTALEAGGIPPSMIRTITKVFVNICMRSTQIVYDESGE